MSSLPALAAKCSPVWPVVACTSFTSMLASRIDLTTSTGPSAATANSGRCPLILALAPLPACHAPHAACHVPHASLQGAVQRPDAATVPAPPSRLRFAAARISHQCGCVESRPRCSMHPRLWTCPMHHNHEIIEMWISHIINRISHLASLMLISEPPRKSRATMSPCPAAQAPCSAVWPSCHFSFSTLCV